MEQQQNKNSHASAQSRAEGANLTDVLAAALKDMLPQERVDFINTISSGYCKHCGWTDPHGNCQCWNDE